MHERIKKFSLTNQGNGVKGTKDGRNCPHAENGDTAVQKDNGLVLHLIPLPNLQIAI